MRPIKYKTNEDRVAARREATRLRVSRHRERERKEKRAMLVDLQKIQEAIWAGRPLPDDDDVVFEPLDLGDKVAGHPPALVGDPDAGNPKKS